MRGLVIYLFIAFGGGYLIDFVWLLPNSDNSLAFQIGASVRMFMPLLGVLAVRLFKVERFSKFDVGLCIGKPFWLFLAPVIPLLVWGISILLHKLFGWAVFSWAEMIDAMTQTATQHGQSDDNVVAFFTWLKNNPFLSMIFIVGSSVFAGVSINALFAFGEEIGWRGYLIHKLFSKNFYVQVVAIGLIWGLWHAPLIFALGYNYPGFQGWVPLIAFIFFTISVSYVLNNLRVLSGSVFPVTLVHGTVNAIGGLMLLSSGENALIGGSAGLVTSLSWLLIGALLDVIRQKYGITTCEKAETPAIT
ncbi:MAG: CPBP family intramembrane metalloprotease [Chlorobi bacterium]|nr:CPBP family intramembrane metalloprotease [Chlorobiota bacterium]